MAPVGMSTMTQAHYIVGDTRQVTVTLPDGCVDLVLTSPPFLALRSYLPADHPDKANEIGSEATPAEFLDVLLELTAEWGRVLAPHGSICVELGDTFSGSGGAGGDYAANGWREGQEQFSGTAHRSRNQSNGAWPLAKSLALVPELYRVALAYGINPLTGTQSPAGRWRVRNVVRWHRPNPPVGALADKYRPATTDMVIATRAKDRWFDLDAVRTAYDGPPPVGGSASSRQASGDVRGRGGERAAKGPKSNPAGAPPLDTWIIPTVPYKGAHYATWPPALCEIPIKSMCPLEVCRTCGTPRRRITSDPEVWTVCDCPTPTYRPGVVLDPFAGTGTTLAVATGHGRNAIGIDIDPRNLDLANDRIGPLILTNGPELPDWLRP